MARAGGVEAAQIDVVELNEAFASQAMACAKDLGLRNEAINKDGGAIALGHPLGATGARIVGKAAEILARDGGRTLSPPSVSAVARVSPPCWSACDDGGRDPRVCVIGAGVMGAGIAAQVANAGVPVLLLDIVPDGAKDRTSSRAPPSPAC